jgi:hypothetical protein
MSQAQAIADATPTTRDRYVDFLRVASLGGVILGHFLMAVVDDRPGVVTDGAFSFTNILALEAWARPGTWILQVMPIFFVVGGFAHATSWRSLRRRGGGYADFARARIGRLVTPALVFISVGMVAGAVVEGTLGKNNDYEPVMQVAGQLLWFIGIYLIAAGFAPPMLRLHERFGWRVLAGLLAAVIAVDVLRLAVTSVGIGGTEVSLDGVKWLNFAFVWLCIHQVGFFYADGVTDRLGARRLGAWMFGLGVSATALLTWLGPYGTSMVSFPGETLSNLTPPTVVLVTFGIAQAGVLLLFRERVSRWLERPRVWRTVIAGGALAMTAYLWHFWALILMYVGFHLWAGPLPEPTTAAWWWLRIPQFVVFLVLVAVLVTAFRWADAPPRRREVAGPRWWQATVAAVGVAAAIVGMLGFAVVGFRGVLSGFVAHVVGVPMTAVASAVLVFASAALTWLASRPRRQAPRG